ncbi:MAG: FAD binding domain-containing protein [Sphaerochaetaceae bacterium]|nr:FAD binding domain-containing protein [Sphaerochaetaceae bacterium]
MPEGLRSPTVFTPKTVSEAIANKLKNPDAKFWAGGTYIMSRPNFYPNPNQRDIISLAGITDLTRIYHADRYLEAGAMVTLQQLLTMGNFIFSKELYKAISDIGSSVIRNQATVGGSLCTSDTRYAMSCILATLNAQAEIRMVSKTAIARWVPVAKLYDRKGNFLFADNAILTKVRIPTDASQQFQFIARTLDSPMQNPNEAVLFGLQYSLTQGNITLPSLCITLPNSCFYMSQDFDNLLSTISFPITAEKIYKVSNRLASDLRVSVRQNTNQLQIERAVRLLEVVLNEINTSYLAG